MFDPYHDEMMYEMNARYDYISELKAEFEDLADDYDDEEPAPCLRGSGWWSARICDCRKDKFPEAVPARDGGYDELPF